MKNLNIKLLFENKTEIPQAARVVAFTVGLVVEDFKSESFDDVELLDDDSPLDDFRADVSDPSDFTEEEDVVDVVVEVVVADAIKAAVFVTLLHFSSTHWHLVQLLIISQS